MKTSEQVLAMKEYKGLRIPEHEMLVKSLSDWDIDRCLDNITCDCFDLRCDDCIFESSNYNTFKEWYLGREKKLKRILNIK